MDKLGTYALVAALKEISKKTTPQPAANERWISLRSCMKELGETSLEPAPVPAREAEPFSAPTGSSPLSTTPKRRDFSYIRQIDQRHQSARKSGN